MRLHLRSAQRWLAAFVAIALPRIARDTAVTLLDNLGTYLFLRPTRRRSLLKRREGRRLAGEGRWFTPAEGELVDALTRVIIPSSADVPGAADMEIIGLPAVQQIDRLVAARQADHDVYARGLIAVDEMARRAHGRTFTDLGDQEKTGILSVMESLHRARTDPSRTGLSRRWRHATGMRDGSSAAADLYGVLVSDTQRVFYSSEIAWLWLEYDGPPMPLGYESPEIPRAPRRAARISEDPRVTHRTSADAANTADVVVIGSGAGGAVVAKELAEAGLSVVVLEAGRRYVPLTDYLTDRADFETRTANVFQPLDERRDVYTTPGRRSFAFNRVKGVGGSTLRYVAMSPRLHESDFATRSTDGVGDDWPITYADLEPYYARVEAELGVSGPDGANPFEPPAVNPTQRRRTRSTWPARWSRKARTVSGCTWSASRSRFLRRTGRVARHALVPGSATWAV